MRAFSSSYTVKPGFGGWDILSSNPGLTTGFARTLRDALSIIVEHHRGRSVPRIHVVNKSKKR